MCHCTPRLLLLQYLIHCYLYVNERTQDDLFHFEELLAS